MATAKEVFDKISQKMINEPAKFEGIDAIYEFNISGDNGGVWTMDLKSDPKAIKEGSGGNANCTITMSNSDFSDMIDGNLNPQMAFMTGKLKVAGDMGLAIKLGSILG